MKMREKVTILLIALMMGPIVSYAEENQVTSECDTTYIKLDENRVPITHVNLTYDELVEKVGELETILETDEFQLYAAGGARTGQKYLLCGRKYNNGARHDPMQHTLAGGFPFRRNGYADLLCGRKYLRRYVYYAHAEDLPPL